MFYLKVLGKETFCCLFHLLEGVCIPWLMAPFCSFTVHHSSLSLLQVFSLTLICLSSSYKNPFDYSGPTWIMQDNLPISSSFCHIRQHNHTFQGVGPRHPLFSDLDMCLIFYSGQLTPSPKLSFCVNKIKIIVSHFGGLKWNVKIHIISKSVYVEYLVPALNLEFGESTRL